MIPSKSITKINFCKYLLFLIQPFMKHILFLAMTMIASTASQVPRQKVYLIGDSTMANKKISDQPETGWGQVWSLFFNDGIEIHNHAVNGRSTKSFREKGHWQEVLDKLKKDDYVIIQFGHNDAKADDSERFADAKTDYKNNLIRYIDEVKAKNAIPILATPVYRRKFDENKQLVDSHGDYPLVVREVARLKNTDLIDLHEESKKIITEHGEKLSKHIYMHFPGNIFPKFPDGIKDDTHFSPYGAKLIASAASAILVRQKHPLRNFLKKSSFSQKYEFELPLVIESYFKKDTFNIVNYGAVKGINYLNTKAIQQAIDNASNTDGGVVLVPHGFWVTGPIELKDNVNLCIAEGGLLQFSDDRKEYPIVSTTWEGQNAYRCQAPISAKGKTNIAITGKGTIDGAGHVWKSVRKSKLTESQWKSIIKTGVNDGQIWYPSESSKLGHESEWAKKITVDKTMADYEKVRDFLRPNFISFMSCDVVLIDGPTFNNSPAWTLHPLMCKHTIVKNVKVINPWYGQNNDAIDMESCQYGILDNCYFDTGDDAITLKSGRDEEGRKRGIPTENWIIKNTTVIHGHGGFVVGSEMSGGVKNIFVDNCTFTGTDIGLRFKTTRGRGGLVSEIYISNIHMSRIIGEAILFSMYYAAKDPIALIDDNWAPIEYKEEPFTDATPVFRDVFMENIYCNGAAAALKIDGLPESNVSNIHLSKASISAELGINITEGQNIHFTDVEIYHSKGAFLTTLNAKDIFFNEVNAINKNLQGINIGGSKTKNIRFKNMKWVDKSKLTIDTKVPENQVKF